MTRKLTNPYEDVTQPVGDEDIGGFYIEKGNLYFLDHGKNGEPIDVYVGPEVYLGKIYEDFSTKYITYEFVFKYNGKIMSVNVPRNEFTATKLQKHTSTGSPFLNSKNNALYIEFLKHFEDEVERITTCNRAGCR